MYVKKQLNLNQKINILNRIPIKKFDECKHTKPTIEIPNINDVDEIFYARNIEHRQSKIDIL